MYEFIEEGRAALARGDLRAATAALFGRNERLNFSAEELRLWAAAERNSGYGLRAECLELIADRR